MLILTWLFIVILLGVAFLFFKNQNPQFALLALSLAVVTIFELFLPLPGLFWVVFWIAWLIALAISFQPNGRNGTLAALAAVIVIAISLVFSPSWSLPQPSAGGYELYLKAENGETPKVDYHANESAPGVSADKPLAGFEAVNDSYASQTLPGNGVVKNWGEVFERLEQASDVIKKDYTSTFDASAHLFGGTLSELTPKLLAIERAGVDTRVIQVQNSTVTDEQARDLVRKDVGSATDSLPIVRVNGAVLTTNGGVGATSVVNEWADARSVVQAVLTVPQNVNTIQPAMASANVQAASVAVDVPTPCTNISKGLVEQPKPQPKTPVTPKTTPTGSTTATPSPSTSTTPPTTTPPTTTPPTTTPPTTTPPTTTPPTTTPPTTTPPTTTPPTTTPPTTTPPTTTPPTTPTPECTYLPPGNGEAPDSDKCLEAKDPTKNHPSPSGKPNAGAPTGAPETTAPVETSPAQPTTQPSSTATQVAPGATTPATPIAVPSSDPVVFPTAGTEIGDPDAATSVVTSQAKLSAEQEVANQQAAQAIVDQAAADAAAQAAADAQAVANAQAAANQAAAEKAAADAAAQAQAVAEQAAADKAAADAAAKAVADKAAADAAAEKAATALAAQQEADKKATEVANQATKDKAAEVAKSVATAPAEVAETSPLGSPAVGFVGLPLLLFGAFRNKKALAGRKH